MITETVERTQTVLVTCDICGDIFDADHHMELQEFLHIRRIGGFLSVFGDGEVIECDICQYCLKDLLKDKYRSRRINTLRV